MLCLLPIPSASTSWGSDFVILSLLWSQGPVQ